MVSPADLTDNYMDNGISGSEADLRFNESVRGQKKDSLFLNRKEQSKSEFGVEEKRAIKLTIEEPVEHINMIDDPEGDLNHSVIDSLLSSAQSDATDKVRVGEMGTGEKSMGQLKRKLTDNASSHKYSHSHDSKSRGNMLSPQLERILIDNLHILELNSRSINLTSGSTMNRNEDEEGQGPKVRMYQADRPVAFGNNNVAYHKMATNTIKEMSCEGSSLEPSPTHLNALNLINIVTRSPPQDKNFPNTKTPPKTPLTAGNSSRVAKKSLKETESPVKILIRDKSQEKAIDDFNTSSEYGSEVDEDMPITEPMAFESTELPFLETPMNDAALEITSFSLQRSKQEKLKAKRAMEETQQFEDINMLVEDAQGKIEQVQPGPKSDRPPAPTKQSKPTPNGKASTKKIMKQWTSQKKFTQA